MKQGETIVQRGQEAIREREAEEAARTTRWREEARKRCVEWFLSMGHFYDRRDHLIPNPKYRSPYGRETRLIENPDNPWPKLEDWEPIEPVCGSTTASTFICEGIRYVCRWKYEGGGDRAYWDDGWWPEWYVVVETKGPLGLFSRRKEIRVHGAASVAEALGAREGRDE